MNRCPHCQQNTLRQVGQSIDCTNPGCPGYTITLPPEQFMRLTAKDFASYKAGQDNRVLKQMDIDQTAFEDRMAQLEIARAARAAARNASEKTFG